MLTSKDTNPKDSIGIEKVPMSMVPAPVMHEIALGMLDGGCKYGPHNYRIAGVRASVYYDAAKRHLDAWWEGQDMDPDCPELNHVAKCMSTLTVLLDAILQDNWLDDRPPKTKDQDFIANANKRAKSIMNRARAKLGELKQRYTEKCHGESSHLTQKQLDSTSEEAVDHFSFLPVIPKVEPSAGDSQSTPSQEPSKFYQKIGKMFVPISKEQLLSSTTLSST